jgi:hypothetical protein
VAGCSIGIIVCIGTPASAQDLTPVPSPSTEPITSLAPAIGPASNSTQPAKVERTYSLTSPMMTGGVTFARVDWRAAFDELRTEISVQPDNENFLTPTRRRWRPPFNTRQAPALLQINALTQDYFSNVATSPVPVLLPFDTAALVADRARGDIKNDRASYSGDFTTLDMINTGPSGYDAVYTVAPGKTDNLPARVFSRPVEIQITGSLITYDVNDPSGGKGDNVASLSSQYPDLRRFIREGYVRYAFTRFGVPYVVSIQCLDSVARTRILSCREAYPIAERFLRLLKVAGGRPVTSPRSRPAVAVDRPGEVSADFTFHTPGEIIAGTGYRKNGGLIDWTSYAQIRFPLERAPAFANSQSFLTWGDCNQTGRSPVPHAKGQAYHCRVNDKPLAFDEKAGENYSYPWRDNFCEDRSFQAAQCPGGFGHQGQDLRPSSCELKNEGADRCIADLHGVVAVRDGVIVRGHGQEAAFLLVNDPGEHIRFRYLHMQPQQLDVDGVTYGRRVAEGEKIGMVSNYQDYAGGTTAHLHFDVQAFTRDGWIWVSPYVTLISAYERMIGARGREIIEPEPAAEPPSAPEMASPDTPRRAADASQSTTVGTRLP